MRRTDILCDYEGCETVVEAPEDDLLPEGWITVLPGRAGEPEEYCSWRCVALAAHDYATAALPKSIPPGGIFNPEFPAWFIEQLHLVKQRLEAAPAEVPHTATATTVLGKPASAAVADA